MKKYKEAILITKENFFDLALMPCVRNITKKEVLRQGVSSAFFEPTLRIEVGNDSGTVGDYLVKDICENYHVMTAFDYERVKNDVI